MSEFVLVASEKYEELVCCQARISIVADVIATKDYVSVDDVLSILGLTEEVAILKAKQDEKIRAYNEKIKNGEILHV